MASKTDRDILGGWRIFEGQPTLRASVPSTSGLIRGLSGDLKLTLSGLQNETGLDEFGAVYEILLERDRQDRGRNLVAPVFAIENRELLNTHIQCSETAARLVALSPSDGTFKEALRYMARLMPTVSVGSRAALLGADLEYSVRSEEGWQAVLNTFRGNAKAGHFKVPHHGSPNADCQNVWDQMLEADTIAIVTPFTSGRGLP